MIWSHEISVAKVLLLQLGDESFLQYGLHCGVYFSVEKAAGKHCGEGTHSESLIVMMSSSA